MGASSVANIPVGISVGVKVDEDSSFCCFFSESEAAAPAVAVTAAVTATTTTTAATTIAAPTMISFLCFLQNFLTWSHFLPSQPFKRMTHAGRLEHRELSCTDIL